MYPLFHKGFLHLWCILNDWFHTEGSWSISIEKANPRLLSTNAQICSSPTHTSKAAWKAHALLHTYLLYSEIKGWISQRRPTRRPRGHLSTSDCYWECVMYVWPFNSCGHFTLQHWCFSCCVSFAQSHECWRKCSPQNENRLTLSPSKM